jgi:hypothetical protein
MASILIDGSYITFAGTRVKVHSVDLTVGGSPVDVTDFDSAMKLYLASLADVKLTFEGYGAQNAIVYGDVGDLIIHWNDGTVSPTYHMQCVEWKKGGKQGGAITTPLSFQPTPA